MDEKAFVDRLYKRDAQRLEMLEKKHKLKDDVNASNEQIDYFWSAFKEMSDNIEYALNSVDNVPSADLTRHFETVRGDLKSLQKYASDSNIFLKDFNIRKSTAIIQNLQTKCTELENKLFPKKKFGFSSKKSAKKPVEIKSMDLVDNSIDIVKKKKWDIITCGFQNIENEKLSLSGEAVLKKDVNLSNLSNCIVTIEGSPATLHLDNITKCVILCGPVSTSIFLDKCVDCKLALACQQLRCHSSINCDIYLHVTSKGIIEDCKAIHVAPYNYKYANMENDFAISPLDSKTNHWDQIDDFNWLSSEVASPNWRVLDENLRVRLWDV